LTTSVVDLKILFAAISIKSGVSVGSACIATKLLHIHSYKITVVVEIKPVDSEIRERFCNWCINHWHDGILDPKLIFFIDKANFNNRY
jgi:hypothetical protein